VGEWASYKVGQGVGLILRAWRPLLRWESRRREVLEKPCVLAFWHGRLLGVLMDSLDSGAVSMASRSSDGAVAAGALEGVGIRVARGSGSLGGREALREMRAHLEAGAPFAGLTVDGPRGPWRKVQPGVVMLARWLRIPVVPATFSCHHARVLNSWDHMVLPRPLTKVVVAYGEALDARELPRDLDEAAGAVTAALDELTGALDRDVAGRDLWPPVETSDGVMK
jgi:lysophospholipid acyltransferase (LPLAT)-like uncharacterized protein